MTAETLARSDYRDAARKMDAMYRHQRHVYDLTRKFYLFGRDQLLAALPITPGSRVLEIGCGTGRNLVKLAKGYSAASLFGIDVSSQMLATAAKEIHRRGLTGNIQLAQASGQNVDPETHFGVDRFDVIYLSYVLSMIPDWHSTVKHALTLLNPGGVLAVVDFGDQRGAPLWRRRLLLGWLDLFDVHPRAEIETALVELGRRQAGLDRWEQILGGYAYLITIRRQAHS